MDILDLKEFKVNIKWCTAHSSQAVKIEKSLGTLTLSLNHQTG